MSRYRRRSGRNSRGRGRRHSGPNLNWLGALMILVVVIAVGIVGYFYITFQENHLVLDEDFCPTNRPANSLTVIMIDRTDPIAPIQQAAVRVRLNDIKASIPRYGEIQVYSVGSVEEEVLTPIVRLCNPGGPSDIDRWTEPQKKAVKRWQEGFEEPLGAVFEQIVESGAANQSPIIESIQSVSVSAFTGDHLRSVEKRMIIISDMLQNSDAFSHYKDGIDFKALRDARVFARLGANLNDVRVTILYLNRNLPRSLQGRGHVGFWEQYIRHNSGSLDHVVAIEG